jgi:SAM-dependent methyltransferase
LLKWRVHFDGWRFTVLRIILKFPAILGLGGTTSQWFQQLEERNFDRRFNISTSGIHYPSDLPPEIKSHAVEYTSSPLAFFCRLLSDLLPDHKDYVFIDFGSGKGKVLFAAAEFPFQRIIGVELSRELHEAAIKNISTYRSRTQKCTDIRPLCQDAGTYQLPTEKLVLYLYNPFSEVVLMQVLDNLKNSILKHPRDIVVVYYNPVYRQLFDKFEMLSPMTPPDGTDSNYAIYRTV